MVEKIYVWAQFPRDPTKFRENREAYAQHSCNWQWTHCLEISVAWLRDLEQHVWPHPYEWTRFAIGVVIGAEGTLSFSETPDLDFSYSQPLQVTSQKQTLYYHTTVKTKAVLFIVGPDLGNEKVTTSVATLRYVDFCEDVMERDGDICVLTRQTPEQCDAAHVVPRRKGSEFLANLTEFRKEPSSCAIIQDIDNVRNGLFLQRGLHQIFGHLLAFLVVPNFAMESEQGPRCIAHHFKTTKFFGTTPDGTLIRSGSDAHIAPNDWPPTVLFDVIYASVILQLFGNPLQNNNSIKAFQDDLYTSDPKTATVRAHQAERSEEDKIRRDERAKRRADNKNANNDMLTLLTLLQYAGCTPERAREIRAEIEERHEAEDRESRAIAEEKVGKWLDNLAH